MANLSNNKKIANYFLNSFILLIYWFIYAWRIIGCSNVLIPGCNRTFVVLLVVNFRFFFNGTTGTLALPYTCVIILLSSAPSSVLWSLFSFLSFFLACIPPGFLRISYYLRAWGGPPPPSKELSLWVVQVENISYLIICQRSNFDNDVSVLEYCTRTVL